MGKKIALRVVIDTNVLISCLLFKGRVSFLRELWVKNKIKPLLSKETFDEFHRVLHYSKFSLSPQEIRSVISNEILPYFDVVETEETLNSASCRDPQDDKFLAVAKIGSASHLITGDQDLLELEKFGSTQILTPRDFYAVFDSL